MSNNISSEYWRSLDESSFLEESATQLRLRHITSIQVRNLTPFPVRDAFASALSQPSARPQFTPHGNLSDDLDITIGRKRGRRISSTSAHSSGGVKSDLTDNHTASTPVDSGFRRRTSSKASATASMSTSVGSSTSTPTNRRPAHRTRANSTASFSAGRRTDSFSGISINGNLTSAPVSRIFSDHSQMELENVVNSRLLETFITLTFPQMPTAVHEAPPSTPTKSSRPHTSPKSPLPSPSRNTSPAQKTFPKSRHKADLSVSSKPMARANTSPGLSKLIKRENFTRPSTHSRNLHLNNTSTPLAFPESTASSDEQQIFSSVPNYISPMHRPSTNPLFSLDDLSNSGVSDWADLSLGNMKVELWGRVGTGWGVNSVMKGKGKEKDTGSIFESEELEWKVLEAWNVNLSDLVPLPEHIASHPSRLPSNTLLVHLSPPDKTFYFPIPSPSRLSSRPSSPGGGHNSDPEIVSSKIRATGESFASLIKDSDVDRGDDYVETSRGWHVREISKTAGWQDFVKLTTLQAVIADTKQSLFDIERKIDYSLSHDKSFILRREISERESWITDLHLEREKTIMSSEELRSRIRLRKENIRQRREALSQVVQSLDQQQEKLIEVEDLLREESSRLASLRSRLSPTRTTLLTTLSSMFPIDLLSPPDLLYTILSVPLPIPLSATDPAPPLLLASYKEVTEDGVATALGYAAQVVHLMAIYLGKVLVYPITCVGSRSLIKDGISAMVGPRMFPLFPKGVDTYRFEYGVFLLNKDIEMLMADKNLRALDMRHTLPNLKNLLLTLTDGEGAQLPMTVHSLNSPAVSGLRSPPRLPSPPAIELTESTPQGSPQLEQVEETDDSDSPTASGSTTPTKASVEQNTPRKSRAFLDLSPLAGFLRSRYPSSIRTGKGSASTDSSDVNAREADEEAVSEETPGSDVSGTSGEDDAKSEINGHTNGHGIAEEKLKGTEEEAMVPTGIPAS